MKKRTRLADRILPDYYKGEEIMNMVTHIIGGALGIVALPLCVIFSALHGNVYGVVGSAIYGFCMIAMYCMSSVYHGLRPGMGKKVLQVLDHCAIYFLIAGTYTVVALSALRQVSPALAWGMFGFQWALAFAAATLTAIDLDKYDLFSLICYVCTGWAILPFVRQTVQALTAPGFYLLLAGGISYTIGAVLYALGSKRHWFHSVFHIFVVLGSLLQFLSILLYGV